MGKQFSTQRKRNGPISKERINSLIEILRKKLKPKVPRHISEEHKERLRLVHPKKYPPDFCAKVSAAITGLHPTEATRIKMSLAKRGEKHPLWRGGLNQERYTPDFNILLKRKIRERDGFVCMICGESENGKALSIHHIDYNKANNAPPNLIALCNNCHLKTGHNREDWIIYFSNYFPCHP